MGDTGIFSGIMASVEKLISNFITTSSKNIAEGLEAPFYLCVAIYIVFMGWRYLTGTVKEPILDLAKNFIKIVIVAALAIKLAQYNVYFVDIFTKGPEVIANWIQGNSSGKSQVTIIDDLFSQIWDIGGKFWEEGGLKNMGMYFVGCIVYMFASLISGIAFFLVLLSKIAIAVLLGLGPLFIIMMLFDSTKKFFEMWIGQLVNYTLIYILVVAVNYFIIDAFKGVLGSAEAAITSKVEVTAAGPVFIVGIIGILILLQVPQIASSLSGGLSLSSMGAGGMAGRSIRGSMGNTKNFAMGAMGGKDGNPMMRGSLSYQAGRGTRAVARRVVSKFK